MYLKPSSAGYMDERKVSSLFYTNVVALMNPLIYSLRNKNVKAALRKNSEWERILNRLGYLSVQLVTGEKGSVFNHNNFLDSFFVSF